MAIDPTLKRVLEFDAGDLALNRRGELSVGQLRRLRYYKLLWGTLKAAPRLPLLIGALFLMCIIVTALPPILIAFSMMGALGYMAWLVYRQWPKVLAQRDDERAKVYAGTVAHLIQRDGQGYLELDNGDALPVQSVVLRAFTDGARYRLFYTPISRYLLAAEPLGTPQTR
jgi:hypothetical protein